MSDESTAQGAPGLLKLPATTRSPWWELGRRVLMAVGILVFTVLLVYFDRDNYNDANDPNHRVSFIDAIYYTTVTLSTTGYGDIAPVSDGARLINAFIITPLRIAFLVLLIGTTLEVIHQTETRRRDHGVAITLLHRRPAAVTARRKFRRAA